MPENAKGIRKKRRNAPIRAAAADSVCVSLCFFLRLDPENLLQKAAQEFRGLDDHNFHSIRPFCALTCR
jgi:hypothetical protein